MRRRALAKDGQDSTASEKPFARRPASVSLATLQAGRQNNMSQLNPIRSAPLASLSGIDHAFFTRSGGVSQGLYRGLNAGLGSQDLRDHVVENRRRMTVELGVAEDRLASPYQIHSGRD